MWEKTTNKVLIIFLDICPVCVLQVDTAAQIPWYERLSELKMPWEMRGNKQTAIKDLNLRVHSGQMLAVIGSSGRNES